VRGLLETVYRFGGDTVLNCPLICGSDLVLPGFIKEKAPRL